MGNQYEKIVILFRLSGDKALYQIKKNGRDGYCWYKNIKKGEGR